MIKIDQWSQLLGYLEGLDENEPITISQIHKDTNLHFNTIKENLKVFQSIQEFHFLLKIIGEKRQFVIKIPNTFNLKTVNMKIDRILGLLKNANK